MLRRFPSPGARLLGTSLTVVLLGGCQATAPSPPPIDQQMNHVLAGLDAIGAVRFPMLRQGSVLPAELERPMGWQWSGPLDQAVRRIARRVGYVAIIPPTRAVPIVSIDRPHSTAAGLIDDLAAAAGDQADIFVDAIHHTIRIVWHV